MTRTARVDTGDQIYHVLNRANGRFQIFNSPGEFLLFEQLLFDTIELTGMRLLAYTIMLNHWHLALYPRNDGELREFMHQLTNAHTRKVHAITGTNGTGHLYQGRYKSFLVDSDSYLLTLIKYIERNPVRAGLELHPEDWKWGSAWLRVSGPEAKKKMLDYSMSPLPANYLDWVNTNDKEDDLELIRTSVNKGMPYGRETWVEKMIDAHKLGPTLRGPGRPRKK